MSSKPGRRPAASFLQIIEQPDLDRMLVPLDFSQKYKRNLSWGNVRLKTRSGKTWCVKVEKLEGERYALTSGWDRFVQDSPVRLRDCVVFAPDRGSCRFDVFVYGVHDCVCECLAPTGNKSFTVHLKECHTYYMDIPKAMATEETGIRAGECVVLRNEEGEEWAVEVCGGEDGGFFVKEGWRAFWDENKLCLGNDELYFVFDETEPQTLLVVVRKGSAPVSEDVNVTTGRKRRRPRRTSV